MENICVTLKSERFYDGMVVRELICKSSRGRQLVTQLQMMNWPDFGVPRDPKQVLNTVNMFEKHCNAASGQSRPTLVHCSAGVGRTGVLIAFLQIKKVLSDKQIPFDFSVKNVIKKLREQRYGMVQVWISFSHIFGFWDVRQGFEINQPAGMPHPIQSRENS